MSERLTYYFENYRFTSIANFKRWTQEPLDGRPPVSVRAPQSHPRAVVDQLIPITIVVPCYNEGPVLGYLENTLDEVSEHFGDRYEVNFVLVNDCSTDDTWEGMKERFALREDVKLVNHEVNKGVAAAIMTRLREAETEIVCSMDADCTYDPHQLENLIPLLEEDVAMVTASPYHDDGTVVGVPEWRLVLSKNLSRLYGTVLHHRFATYTACFRAYRKSKVAHIELENGGFLGVAELLIK
jgi:glycosyltransferase involved in cell wall biosynthesis